MDFFDDFFQPHVTITIDNVGDGFVLVYRGRGTGGKIPMSETLTEKVLKGQINSLRAELSKWPRAYDDLLLPNKTDRVTLDRRKTREMWTNLAQEGRDLYRLLFDLDDRTKLDLVNLAERLGNLKAGSMIELDPLDAPLPWSLLYEGDIPRADDSDYLEKLIPHFWGIRYKLTLQPIWGVSSFNNPPYLSNNDGTRLTVAINQKSDGEYRTGQMSFFSDMKEKFSGREGAGGLALGTCKQDVIDNLRTRDEPQHLFYFYCHHEKGDGEMTIAGVPVPIPETQIIMEGDEQGVITLKELSRNSEIQPFKFRPVIFLNACQSSKLEMGDPTSFMTYFIRRLDSWSFMGTEADIPAPFADEFGKAFVSSFLEGIRLGEILFDLRNKYAKDHLNPFGLYYTLFGRNDIYLQHPVKELQKAGTPDARPQ